jgi:hypothetical protein
VGGKGDRERLSSEKIVDSMVFFLALGGAFTYVLHGKPIADRLFNDGATWATAGFNNLRVYGAVIALALYFVVARLVPWPNRFRFIVGSMVAVVGPLAVQLQATEASAMIFVLHVYLSVVALAVVAIEPVFQMSLQDEFWRKFFASSTKAVSYVFTLFSAGLAILQYVSKGLNESIPGYLTSLAYPIGALVLSLGIVAYWILAPSWRKYVATYS